MAAKTATPSELAQQILDHKPSHYTFTFSPFLRGTYGHGLPPNRPICKDFQAGHCPRGAASCPDRHVAPTAASTSGNASYNSLVCKHWLRALCKKGESCEFLHEYNLRKMPECNFFVRNGYCSNGDECLYLHIDPQSKLPPCPHYDKGFCPLGPQCSKKHVRRKLCPYYLAGFCPAGRACLDGAHPRWEKNLERPVAKSEVAAQEEAAKREQAEAAAAAGVGMGMQMGGGGGDDDAGSGFGGGPGGGHGGGHDHRGGKRGRGDHHFGGGRGGRWRGRGDRKFRGGRGHH